MDEVDFTILAATSVFTDLMEKCPPAEACRDAFDRTAKATIKMTNSTGGFGQLLPPPPQRRKRRNSRSNGSLDDRLNWSSRADAASSTNRSGAGQHHHNHQQRMTLDQNPRQPPSQYDMMVASDAYSTSAASSTLRASPQQRPPKRFRPSTTDLENNFIRHPPAQPHSTTSSTDPLSPDTTLDPALLPSPSQKTPPGPRLDSSPSVPSLNPAATNFYDPLQNQTPLFTNSDLQGGDYLQSLPGDSLGTDFGGGGGQDTQMDLNFGLGWEGIHHDFSDGQQLDLFDGFFFGDQRGGAGGGNGMGMSAALDQGTGGMKGERAEDGQGSDLL